MTASEPIQRVTIYISERDMFEGQPLYLAVLERLRREGATGGTAIRGIAGFGARHQLRTGGIADLNQAPLVIEWIDRADRVARVLPVLDTLLPNALITIEEMRVYRAELRSSGPFSGRSIGEVVTRDIATLPLAAQVAEAARLMIARRQAIIPLLDAQGRVARVVGTGDLEQRAGLKLPIRLISVLAPEEQAEILAAMPARSLADLIIAEPRTIYIESSIPQAISMLVEWDLPALPVVDREGRLAGIFGIEEALRAAVGEVFAPSGVRVVQVPPAVQLVMQALVPTVSATASLAAALAQLLATPGRFLVVVDAGVPIGILDDAQVLGRLPEPVRSAWINALGAPASMAPQAPPDLLAHMVAQAPVPQVTPLTSQDDAMRRILDEGLERLIVVDEQGRLAGVLARRGLLRALAQESVR